MMVLGSPARYFAVSLTVTMLMAANAQPSAAQDVLKNFVTHEAAKPVATISFADVKGTGKRLADFKGKVVVLNIWATWCTPCRKEMPALDRLQAALGETDFAVLPLSIDRGGVETITKFYTENGIRTLPIYVDVSGKSVRELGAVGLPTTLILDRVGQEVARVVGPAEWDAPEVLAFLQPIIAKPAPAIQRAERDADPDPALNSTTPSPFARGLQWIKTLLTK